MLQGAQLATGRLAVPKGAEIVTLYWAREATRLPSDLTVRLEARPQQGRTNRADHLPGDWLMPADRWPAGRLIVDPTLFRLRIDPPEGTVGFWVGLKQNKTLVPLVDAGDTPSQGNMVFVGESVYDPKAPRLFQQLQGPPR